MELSLTFDLVWFPLPLRQLSSHFVIIASLYETFIRKGNTVLLDCQELSFRKFLLYLVIHDKKRSDQKLIRSKIDQCMGGLVD